MARLQIWVSAPSYPQGHFGLGPEPAHAAGGSPEGFPLTQLEPYALTTTPPGTLSGGQLLLRERVSVLGRLPILGGARAGFSGTSFSFARGFPGSRPDP